MLKVSGLVSNFELDKKSPVKWVWDIDDNPIHAEDIPEGGPCGGEVTFFTSYVDDQKYGMCMSCCVPWEEEGLYEENRQ